MELEAGKAFRLEETNPAVAGCTVSQQIAGGRNPLWIFSLGKGTDISGELYPYHKLLLVQEGQLKVRADRAETVLDPGQCFLAPRMCRWGWKPLQIPCIRNWKSKRRIS